MAIFNSYVCLPEGALFISYLISKRTKLIHEIQSRNSAPWQQSAEERQVLGGKVGDLLLRIASHRLEEGKICGAMTWWEVDLVADKQDTGSIVIITMTIMIIMLIWI